MKRRNLIKLLAFAAAASHARPSLARSLAGAVDLTGYGFRRRTLQSPAGDMAVFEAGEGEPLLLLHGVGAGASSFLWYRLAPALAERYRVVAPDFVGWGQSHHPARFLLFDDYVRQVKFLGEWIGTPARVVAQSLTCGFVIAAQRDGGFQASRLVLHAPSGGFDFAGDSTGMDATGPFRRFVDEPEAGQQFYTRAFHARENLQRWYEGPGFLDPAAVPPELVEASLQSARQPNAAWSALAFLTGELRYDIAPLLAEAPAPAMMVWGEQEIQIAPDTRERLERVNPDIEVARIAGARTCFEIEQPEATLAAITPFLGMPD